MSVSRLAITGSTGFIGGCLLRQALSLNLPVRVLRRSPTPGSETSLSVEWVTGDIRDSSTWDRLLPGCDTVIHLAAEGVTKIDDVFDAVHVNLPSLAHLLKAAAEHGVRRVVLAGTCMEYGATGDLIGGRPLRESDPLAPTNAYAAAKAAATMIVSPLARDLGLELFVLRPFYVYGPSDRAYRLVPAVVRMALGGERIRTTDGRQVRDFVHLEDVARAFLDATTVRWPGGTSDYGVRIVNIGTGRPTPLYRLVESIAELCGRSSADIEFGAIPHRHGEMWRLVADRSAAEELLGWRPTIDLERGLAELVAVAKTGPVSSSDR